jgi:hypothetical protein
MIGYIFLYFILSMIASFHYVVWDQKIIRPLILVAFFIFWPLLLLGHYLQFLYWILKE